MQKDVLEKSQRILRKEHLDTILAMNNLAAILILGQQGQLDEAAKMQKDALEKWRQILRGEHLDTIRAMNNLARTLKQQG
jgi:tetratricopeptide (TPR) repeat protein